MKRITTGYYWSLTIDPEKSTIVARLYPEVVLWHHTALFHYNYSGDDLKQRNVQSQRNEWSQDSSEGSRTLNCNMGVAVNPFDLLRLLR